MSIFDTNLVEKQVDISDDAYRFSLVLNHLVGAAQDRALCFCFESGSYDNKTYMERVRNQLSWYLEGLHDGVTPIDVPSEFQPVNRVLDYKVSCKMNQDNKIQVAIDYKIDQVVREDDIITVKSSGELTQRYLIDTL